jgi:Predicted outer membrane protein
MSLMTMIMLATFVFASPMQQSDTQSSPTKQDKSASSSTKGDKHDHSMQNDKHSDSMHDTMSNTTLNSDDRKFIMEAAHGGMMEVKLGHLAADKATNADVKQFGQRMVDDHSKANSELMALASQKGVTLPAMSDTAMMNSSSQSTDQATATSQAMDQQSTADTAATKERHARVDTGAMLKDGKEMNKLSGLSGDAFDREYVNMMVKDHEKDVKEFETASMKAKDLDVRAFAAKTLPTLREHLQQVRDIQSRMKSSNQSMNKN